MRKGDARRCETAPHRRDVAVAGFANAADRSLKRGVTHTGLSRASVPRWARRGPASGPSSRETLVYLRVATKTGISRDVWFW